MAIWLFFSSHGGHRDLHVLTHPFPPRRSSDLNFEARIHPNIKANFLASPPLVVAYALAGTVLRDLMTEPVGQGKNGDVWLGDIWPSDRKSVVKGTGVSERLDLGGRRSIKKKKQHKNKENKVVRENK